MSRRPSEWNKGFEQTADIDASDTAYWNEGAGWRPLGTADQPFSGSYLGNGFRIFGLTINRPDENHVGFIGYAESAQAERLGLVDVRVSGADHVGALGGFFGGFAKQCYATGTIRGQNKTGGLIGSTTGSFINESFAKADVFVTGNDGGRLIGALANTTFVQNSYARHAQRRQTRRAHRDNKL